MGRLPLLTPDRMTEEQRKVYEEFRAVGGPTVGPYTAYVRIPDFMRLNRDMGNYLRRNSLPGRIRQLIVLKTIRHWDAKYPWAVHSRGSLKEGVEQSVIDAIGKGQEPALTSPKDIAALQVCKELLETQHVSDATYKRALELFGESGLVDIVATTGFYTMVSFTVNAFDVDPPSD
jgi:4-carboxymuconolactone decarboxylase